VPYITFVKLIRAINDIAAQRIPERLQVVDLSGYGHNAGRVLHALRFLGFIDPDGHTTLDFHRYAKGDAESRRQLMVELVKSRYAWVWELPEGTQYKDFLSYLEAKGNVHRDTRRRAASFLVSASRSLRLELPVVLPKRGRPRGVDRSQPPVSGPVPNRVDRYFSLLTDLVRDQETRNGAVDPTLLDRIERLLTTFGVQ
jgi:hypothetical protein